MHLSAETFAMRWPIRNQILVPLLAVAIVSLTAVGAINTVLTERRTREHVEQQVRQVIGVLTTSSFPLTDSVLRQMRELSTADYVLIDPAGATAAAGTDSDGEYSRCAAGAFGRSCKALVFSYTGKVAWKF
jgi:hypothetical protein